MEVVPALALFEGLSFTSTTATSIMVVDVVVTVAYLGGVSMSSVAFPWLLALIILNALTATLFCILSTNMWFQIGLIPFWDLFVSWRVAVGLALYLLEAFPLSRNHQDRIGFGQILFERIKCVDSRVDGCDRSSCYWLRWFFW
jgi:hypothetical protein